MRAFKRISALLLTLLMVASLFTAIPAVKAEAATSDPAISNGNIQVKIGDLGQIETLNIVNNPKNKSGSEITFVMPNNTSNQNNTAHQWMGELIFATRTSDTADFSSAGSFVEVDTNRLLAAGGSTTFSDATSKLAANPYIKKSVYDDSVEIEFIGQDLSSTTSRTLKGFDVLSEFDLGTDDGSLQWNITLENKSEKYIEFGDIGLPMPWNNKYDSQANVYNQRMTVHTFAGADSGYAYAIRCSGEGNYILFTPVVSTGARIEYVDNWIASNNGITDNRTGSLYTNWTGDSGGWQCGLCVYYIHSAAIHKTGRSYFADTSTLVLAPGESKTYSFKFSAVRAGDNTPQSSAADHNNASDSVEERENNMRSILYKEGLIDAIAVPSFQTAINMDTRLDLHYDEAKIRVNSVKILDVTENDPFDTAHIPNQSSSTVNNSRTGRGLPAGNPDYDESVTLMETKLVNGEYHHIYNLTFGCLGNNSVRVEYQLKVGDVWVDKFTEYEFNVLAELDEIVQTHADWMVEKTQDTNTSSSTYGIYSDWYISQERKDSSQSSHWGDDWSHDNVNFMAMKNYLNPDAGQIASLEKYLIDFMWGTYMKNTHSSYTVANYLSAAGSSSPYTRTFSEMMEATAFFNMYRIMKAYPALMSYRQTATFYLEIAYGIYYNRVGSGAVGYYGEQQVPDIIEALYAEDMTAQGDNLKRKFAQTKAGSCISATYPYGSEFAYDNTGEEGAYAAARALLKYYPASNNASGARALQMQCNKKTRAMRGIQPTWYQYADPVFIGGESWWNFQYTASLAGSIMDDYLRYDSGNVDDTIAYSERLSYGAKLSNFNCVNMGQISAKSVGAVSWRYNMYKGGYGAMNVNDGGTRIMNNGWQDFSGESDEGLYGSLLRISSDAVTDPVFGLVGYGCDVLKADGVYTILPKDGFGKRFNELDDRIYAELIQDSATAVSVDPATNTVTLTVKCYTNNEHESQIKFSGAGMANGIYQILVNGEYAGRLRIVNNEGTAKMTITGADAVVEVSPLLDASNEAPTVTVKEETSKQGNLTTGLRAVYDDDGLPFNGEITYKWEILSKPEGAVAVLSGSNELAAVIYGSKQGEYTLQFTACDGDTVNGVTVKQLTVTLTASGSAGAAGDDVAPDASNVESDYTSSWENLNGINNVAFEPTSSNPGTGKGWGNWSQSVGSEHYVGYTWDTAVTVSSSDIYWYDDGGGTQIPSTFRIAYLGTDGEWHDATLTTAVADALKKNQYNRVEFEPVTSTRIRLYQTVRSGSNANGVCRWKLYAFMDVGALEPITAATTVGVIPVLPGSVNARAVNGALMPMPVLWEEITADMVAAPGTFTVYGLNTSTGLTTWCKISVGADALPEVCSHTFEMDTSAPSAPTCTEDGIAPYVCTKCGETYSIATAALGHDYVGVIDPQATCTDAGVMTYTCSRCSDSYTEPVAALGHEYVYTPNNDGTHAVTCSRCDYSGSGTCDTDGLGGRCSLCGYKKPSEEPKDYDAVVVAGSDFQNYADSGSGGYSGTYTKNQAFVQSVLTAMNYDAIDGFLFGGDYNFAETTGSTANTATGIAALKACVKDYFPTLSDSQMVLIQGNHDAANTPGMASTGACDQEAYGVYAINEDDYMNYSSSYSAKIQTTAAGLETYLKAKADADWDKPIFVISHLPLHFGTRTSLQGDGMWAHYIFDLLNEYGRKLNIFYLFGHDHAYGYDSYLGGSAIFLTRGDTLNIANLGSQSAYTAETLNFTYMNAGYTGYFWFNYSGTNPDTSNPPADSALTMTSFEIKGNTVTVHRWDANGLHNLKAAGATISNSKSGSGRSDSDVGVTANTVTYGNTVVVGAPSDLFTYIDGNVTVTTTELLKSITATAVTNITLSSGYAGYIAYDIAPEQAMPADGTANIAITVPADYANAAGVTVFYLNNGILEPVEASFAVNGANGTVTVHGGKLGTYVVAKKQVRRYVRINDISELKDGAQALLFVSNTHKNSGSNLSQDYQMLPVAKWVNSSGTVVDNLSDAYRVGFDIVSATAMNIDSLTEITGDYTADEWTFTANGSAWVMSAPDGDVYMTANGSASTTVFSSENATDFTITEYNNTSTFIIGTASAIGGNMYYFDYNTRGLVCGYTQHNNDVHFYIYVLDGGCAHSYQLDASKSVAATCTAAGKNVYTCSKCGDSYEETVKALSHDYIYTDNEDGETHTVTCSRCDCSVTEAHEFVNGVCVCGAADGAPTVITYEAISGLSDLKAGEKYVLALYRYFGGSDSDTYNGYVFRSVNNGDLRTVTSDEYETTEFAADADLTGVYWYIEPYGTGYSIKNVDTGKYLTSANIVASGDSAEAMTIVSGTSNGKTNYAIGTSSKAIRFSGTSNAFSFSSNSPASQVTGTNACNVIIYKVTGTAAPCEHDYAKDAGASVAATCTGPGKDVFVCSKCGDSYEETVKALGHDYEDHAAQAATCLEIGWDAYRTCSRCDYTEYVEIKALGHDIVKDEAVPPTCLEPGKGEGEHCTRCDYKVEQEPVSALGHDFEAEVLREPTEDAEGETGYTCSRCGAFYAEPIDKLPCPSADYTDVNQNLWYHSAVDYVIENGYMGSTKTDALTFEPNTKVSRAMVASIMYRIAGTPAVEYKGSFTDVKAGKWFTDAIEWAAQNGLAAGKGDGKFDPNGNVTRQELAVFMYKLAEFLGRDVTATADLSGFPDAKTVPAWAKPYVQWAVAAGLISGKSSGGVTKLAPVDNATRAEFASIITRFMAG